MLSSEEIKEIRNLIANYQGKFIASEMDYDKFIEFLFFELAEASQSKNMIDDLLSSAKSDEIRNDISNAISRIRERKINDLINEK